MAGQGNAQSTTRRYEFSENSEATTSSERTGIPLSRYRNLDSWQLSGEEEAENVATGGANDTESAGENVFDQDASWLDALDDTCNACLCEIEQHRAEGATVRLSNIDWTEDKSVWPYSSSRNETGPHHPDISHSEISPLRNGIDSQTELEREYQATLSSNPVQENGHYNHQEQVRLLLIGGLSKGMIQRLKAWGVEVPSLFFKRHVHGTAFNGKALAPGQNLHIGWMRAAAQTIEQWNIGQASETKGWSVSKHIDDRAAIRLRYDRSPALHRRYEPLSSTTKLSASPGLENRPTDKAMFVAAQQMCSVVPLGNQSNALALDGVILFDAPRKYASKRKAYRAFKFEECDKETMNSFHDFESDQQRFLKKLGVALRGNALQSLPPGFQERLLITMACEDHLEVIHRFGALLDDIDIAMARDDIVQGSIRCWRKILGTWRVYLNHTDEFVDMIKSHINGKHGPKSATHTGPPVGDLESRPPNDASVDDEARKTLSKLVPEVEEKSRSAFRRCETTFTALMSTMTIIESEMAIREATEVSKLTKLAFFFIPLTFVASVCGMNLAEFQDHTVNPLKAWLWAVCSAIVLLSTYFVLYLPDIVSFLRKSLELLWICNRWEFLIDWGVDCVYVLSGALIGLQVAVFAAVHTTCGLLKRKWERF